MSMTNSTFMTNQPPMFGSDVYVWYGREARDLVMVRAPIGDGRVALRYGR
jgi:hypothetical protein